MSLFGSRVSPHLTQSESSRIPVDPKEIEEETARFLSARSHQLTQFVEQAMLQAEFGVEHGEGGNERTCVADIESEIEVDVGQEGPPPQG